MLGVDSLIVIGMTTVSLGTIQEADGMQEHTFWLRNCGSQNVTLVQGYTSCGCTTIDFAKDEYIAPSDSTSVTLRFNPRGKGGEFEETGTIVYSLPESEGVPEGRGGLRKRISLSLIGTCITSEETLLKQFPIRINDNLRLSTDRFDFGRMGIGETKERGVVILHCNEDPALNRQERLPVTLTIDETMPKGLQHIPYSIITTDNGQETTLTITIDVFIR